MEKDKNFQEKKIGKPEYLNKNCWLVKNLGHSSAKRCQYCELKFHNCLFFQYLIISLILILFLFIFSFLIKGEISRLIIITIFTLVIVYGYFFNKSTEKIIQANFTERKAKEELRELNEKLEERVNEQTKEIKEAYNKVERAYEIEKRAGKELEGLSRAKDQFIMATQHHLRTPLTSMRGYLDLILGGSYGKISKKVKEILKKLEISTKNGIKIINELLDISQFQLGKGVITFHPDINIEPIIKEIIEELKFEVEQKNIYLRLEKLNDIPLIKADPQKLKVALSNIVDNAIKYTCQGGIVIKIKNQTSNIKIIIQDTGIGIPKAELENLFNKTFERGKEAAKLWGPGKGIGLFLTHQIIKSHNGRIWADSEGKGKGSAFFVELPLE